MLQCKQEVSAKNVYKKIFEIVINQDGSQVKIFENLVVFELLSLKSLQLDA